MTAARTYVYPSQLGICCVRHTCVQMTNGVCDGRMCKTVVKYRNNIDGQIECSGRLTRQSLSEASRRGPGSHGRPRSIRAFPTPTIPTPCSLRAPRSLPACFNPALCELPRTLQEPPLFTSIPGLYEHPRSLRASLLCTSIPTLYEHPHLAT